MGNRHSGDVAEDVKKQADDCDSPIYQFTSLKGAGKLVDMMKQATKDNDYEEVSWCVYIIYTHHVFMLLRAWLKWGLLRFKF